MAHIEQVTKEDLDIAKVIITNLYKEQPLALTPIMKGEVNKVILVRLSNNKEIILRMNKTPNYLSKYENEAWAMKEAKKKGIPVPDVIKLGKYKNYAYTIHSKVPGNSAENYTGNKSNIWKQVGQYTKLINSIETKGIGERAEHNFEDKDSSIKWKDYIVEKLNEILPAVNLIEKGLSSEDQLNKAISRLQELKNWKFTPNLSHGNLEMKNIIIDEEGNITGIIDWGETASHRSPHYDIAMSFYWISEEEQNAFLEGYGLNKEEYDSIKTDIYTFQILYSLRMLLMYLPYIDNNKEKVNYIVNKLKSLVNSTD